LTDPEMAAAFVADTHVDALAVAVGNVHTLEGNVAEIDLDRLEQIHKATGVPLVIHGGTGFPAAAVPDAIARGVAKFNVGTALKRAVLDDLADRLGRLAPSESPHDLLGSHRPTDLLEAAKAPLIAKVRELIRLYGASGQAA
jgi:fructose-bisphosphate aldolase class II